MGQVPHNIFEDAYDELIDDGSYLASSKTSRKRHLPSPDWFAVVVWEVIITFFLGLLSGLAANRLSQNKRLKQCQDELNKLRSEKNKLANELAQEKVRVETLTHALNVIKSLNLEKGTIKISLKIVNKVSKVLEKNGWPKDIADMRSDHLVKAFLEHIRDFTGK
jgi:hypothetical protein